MLFPSRQSIASDLLRASDLVCERGERALFAPVSFALNAGELIEVRGANGIGKTTLLRALAGLSRPAQGGVFHPLAADDSPTLAYIGHLLALHPQLTILENLRFWSQIEGREPDNARLDAALARTGLLNLRSSAASRLSQGERRRVALARLCATQHALWILDEPDTGLDESGLQLMRTLFAEHLERGGGAIVATHLPQPLALNARALWIEAAL